MRNIEPPKNPSSTRSESLGLGCPDTSCCILDIRNRCAVLLLSPVRLFAIPWTAACQAPLPMEFHRQEFWRGVPFPPPGDLPHPKTESKSPVSPALAGRFFNTSTTWEAWMC